MQNYTVIIDRNVVYEGNNRQLALEKFALMIRNYPRSKIELRNY